MKISAFFAAAVIAMQIVCTWWLTRYVDKATAGIAYNAAAVKFAADDWESGKSTIACRQR